MADSYWISFHISETGNADRRYQALIGEVRKLTVDAWWTESVNFLLFNSHHEIDEIAARIHAAFDPDLDLALLVRTDMEEARAVGAITDGILFELLPSARRFLPARPPAPPHVPMHQ